MSAVRRRVLTALAVAAAAVGVASVFVLNGENSGVARSRSPLTAPQVAAQYYSRPLPRDPSDPHDQDRQTRWAFALRHDRAYVDDLHRQAAAGASGLVRELNILMTVAEAAEFRARIEARDADLPKVRLYFRGLDDVFAGVYLDHPAGGRVTALVTRDAGVHEAALRASAAFPERLAVVAVANTLEELRVVEVRVQALREDAGKHGIDVVGTGRPTPDNVVVIEVTSAEGASDYFEDRLPAGTFSIREAAAPPQPQGQ